GLSRIISLAEPQEAGFGRWQIWEGALHMLERVPWYGDGVGTFWLTYPAYRVFDDTAGGQNPHNDYLQYLIEAGIPGLALLLSLVLFLSYQWWQHSHNKHVSNRHVSNSNKIEATGIYAGIAAVGLHAFFTHNFGVFSILFLIGILLARFIDIQGDTKTITLSNCLPLRQSIFSFSIFTIGILLSLYLVSATLYSIAHNISVKALNNGDAGKAEQYLTWSQRIFNHDDRALFLYALIHERILNEVNDIKPERRAELYRNALILLKGAEKINPLRPNIAFIRAQLIHNNPELSGHSWRLLAVKNYQHSIAIDPRFIPGRKAYAELLVENNQLNEATKLLRTGIKYFNPPTMETLNFYLYALELFKKAGDTNGIKKTTQLRDDLIESLGHRGIKVTLNQEK
ncbi:MAG: O-antigen ligase family protein, partial [Gammaproteobacteria bacterium]|nr:O-antigen ligase family protein [Gammaproteobacteria bacterium]